MTKQRSKIKAKNTAKPTADQSVKLVTQSELIKLLGISKSLVAHRWLKESNPVPRIQQGKSYVYDLNGVFNWLKQTGKKDHAVKLEQAINFTGSPKAENVNVNVFSSDSEHDDILSFESIGIHEAFTRLGRLLNYRLTFLEKQPLDTMLNTTEMSNIQKLFTELRQMQSAQMTMDQELKKVMPMSEFGRFIGTLLTILRTNIMSLPFTLSDEFAAINDPSEIRELLNNRLSSQLNEIANIIKNKDFLK